MLSNFVFSPWVFLTKKRHGSEKKEHIFMVNIIELTFHSQETGLKSFSWGLLIFRSFETPCRRNRPWLAQGCCRMNTHEEETKLEWDEKENNLMPNICWKEINSNKSTELLDGKYKKNCRYHSQIKRAKKSILQDKYLLIKCTIFCSLQKSSR